MAEDEFVALAAVAGWIIDICPVADEYNGIAVQTVGGKWYAETGNSPEQVADRLREKIFP